jgi:hypothetical protein
MHARQAILVYQTKLEHDQSVPTETRHSAAQGQIEPIFAKGTVKIGIARAPRKTSTERAFKQRNDSKSLLD